MKSPDGKTVIVFNGEIYNFRELRLELEQLGHSFASNCDTEVVLKAFLEWDTDCFSKLRGMFAVAFWNETRSRLVLGRDRSGIKPLYYFHDGQDVVFGSELKTLFAHPSVERTIDLNGLSHFLSLNFVPTPYTLVEGIRKLPPGHWLEWNGGNIAIEPYWSLKFDTDPNLTFEEAKLELDGLLRSSIREQMVADVPLGIWSSGGLDSSTILHYAAEASSRPLKTFSISFSGQGCDESGYFRETARRYGSDHHEFDMNEGLDLAAVIERMAFYSDEPSADAGAVPVWYLSKMSRKHVTVALSGDGGDELFGGYLTYLADGYARTMRHLPGVFRRGALSAARRWPVSDRKIGLEYKVKRMLEGTLLPETEAHFFWNGTFSRDEKRRLCPDLPRTSAHALMERLPDVPAGKLDRFLYADQHYYLTDDILYKCDRMSMAHSLEVRPPFLDHRVIEFAARLPENFKIRGGTLKYILRELMKDKLPKRILKRPKEGLDIPAHGWLRGPLRELLLDTLTESEVRRTGLFEWKYVERLLTDHLLRRANYGYHLWGLLTLFLWMRHWDIRTGHGSELKLTPASSFSLVR